MNPIDESVWTAAVAGLLHDVGKFTLRAGRGGNRTWDQQGRTDFGYKHAMLSATFVEDFAPAAWRVALSAQVGNHHRPQPGHAAELAVTLADHLSAAERDDGIDDEEMRKVHPRQLRSIFASLTADGQTLSQTGREQAYWPLSPLVLNPESLFPQGPLAGDAVWQAYDALVADFERHASDLRSAHEAEGDLDAYLESLLLLLQRYTWSVPSAYYNNVPDISLYDHSRTTAALAAVLVAEGHSAANLASWKTQPARAPALALLVGADVSGVQDFLYTITSRGATSALRGRSFYLQMLTEAIARYVLRALGLPITNLLYAGGGHFYLLAAPSHAARLDDIRRDVSRVLLQHHRGALYVGLAHTPLAGADFFDGKISAAWVQVGEGLQRAKLHRFAELETADLAQLFSQQEDGGNEERECKVCGLEHPQTAAQDGVRKCPACRSYEQLGKDLRNARYLLLEHIPAATADTVARPGDAGAALAALGLRVTLYDDLFDVNSAAGIRATLLALQDDAVDELRPGRLMAVGRRFLANATPILNRAEIDRLRAEGYQEEQDDPLRPDNVKPYNVLAHEAAGIKRLGVLRMDVDNLGKLFAEGLGAQATLSRVASLSFAVNLYFEGWVDQIARTEEFKRHIYCIYSGGDDLFFVGAWDRVVEFGRRVRGDFTRYVAGHPGLHTSAGIALAAAKFPLAQAARAAGDAETAAKAYRTPDSHGGKDAVCFLGSVQPWHRFGLGPDDDEPGMATAHALMRLLVELVEREDSAAPRGLVRQLVRLSLQYEAALNNRRAQGDDRTQTGAPQVLWGPWMWQGVYRLARMTGRVQDAGVRRHIDALKDHLRKGETLEMEWLGLAARWAELKIR